MLVSRCCKSIVFSELDYFICDSCGKPCDVLCPLVMEHLINDDNGLSNKTQKYV